jgi:arginine decarboxylase
MILPTKVFFTKGVGRDKERLKSFELALRDAGIEKFNIVNVSSILPPGCKIIAKDKGLGTLNSGQVIFCVMARNETHESNRLISAAIGCAVPADDKAYGYLSEHHDFGLTTEKAEDYAEDLAATMLASTLGVDFNPDSSYDEKKEVWKISDKIFRTRAIAQSAIGDKNGLWTSVVAAAVFVCDENGN